MRCARTRCGPRRVEWLGHDVGVVVCDGLSLAFTERGGRTPDLSRRQAARGRRADRDRQAGSAQTEIEPGLSRQVRVAGYCKVDGYANAYLTGARLSAGAARGRRRCPRSRPRPRHRREARLLRGRDLAGPVAGRRIVLAGGVWIEPMLAWLGVRSPDQDPRQPARPSPSAWRPVMRTQSSASPRVFCRSSNIRTARW